MTGLYIHIPFCESRCIYCGFYSSLTQNVNKIEHGKTIRQRYINAVCKEMSKHKAILNTIYLGGGTPSQLSPEELNQIFNQINKTFLQQPEVRPSLPKEITIECNPEDVTPNFVQALSTLPVNRISMGVQTFNDERLKFIHRRHSSNKILEAVRLLRNIGINNISIDLMFGFPKQTQEEWIDDIKKAISLNVEHISAYSLMYEEGTPLYAMLKHHKITQIGEEQYRNMYEELIDRLEIAGYEQYEISNFAKHGFHSLHNSSYWHNVPYIGVGAAAHSYNLRCRRWNYADINKYVNAIEHDNHAYEEEIIDDNTHYNDSILTALRTKEGLNIDGFDEKYKTYFLTNAAPYIENGNMGKHDNNYFITRKGLYISDAIMTDLIMV